MGNLKNVLNNLEVGDKIYFINEKRGFEIKARNDRYIICTKPHFKTVMYTIIDTEKMINSTNDRIWSPYDYKIQKDINQCLEDLVADKISLSSRNRVACNFDRYKKKNSKTAVTILKAA